MKEQGPSEDPRLPTSSAEESLQPPASWEEPRWRRLGDVRELVRGGGKLGSNLDGDPGSTRKSGAG